MMRPQFNHWLGALCLYYSDPDWPTEENVKATFRDVQYMDGQALEFIGSHIRREYKYWPKSLSHAMHKAYGLWEREQAKEKAQEAEKQRKEPSPEEWAENQARTAKYCRLIRERIRALPDFTSPYKTDESGKRYGHGDTDAYRRSRGR